MKTRIASLLLIVVVALSMAPAAMAQCRRCSLAWQDCIPVSSFGYEICVFEGDGCYLENRCPAYAETSEPLAAEFTVASVERLDEPQTAAPQTLVAVAATPAPATR